MCKLPLSVEVCGYCIPSPPVRTNTSTLRRQARVCVAAISKDAVGELIFL